MGAECKEVEMAKVNWSPIKPGDARDVSKINTCFSSFNTQSAAVDRRNIREEGLDYGVMATDVAHKNDVNYSANAYWDPNISTSVLTATSNSHHGVFAVPVSGLGTDLGDTDGCNPLTFDYGAGTAMDLRTNTDASSPLVVPANSTLRIRASVHFCPTLESHAGIPGGSSYTWPGLGQNRGASAGDGATTHPTICATVKIEYLVNGAGSNTVLSSRTIGEPLSDINRMHFDATVTIVDWYENTTSSDVNLDFVQIVLDNADTVTDGAEGRGYFTVTAAQLHTTIFKNTDD